MRTRIIAVFSCIVTGMLACMLLANIIWSFWGGVDPLYPTVTGIVVGACVGIVFGCSVRLERR